MFNPNDYKDDVTPEKQESENTYVPAPSGANIVVNVGLKRSKFSSKMPDANGNFTHFEKLTITAKIVENVKVKNKADAKAAAAAVGKTISFDFWTDFTKLGNAKRLAAMCLACGVEEEFDPADDEALLNAICGTPYGLVHDLKTRSWTDRDGNKKNGYDFDVKIMKPLKDPAEVKRIMGDPDFTKQYKAEFKECKDNRKTDGAGGGGSSEAYNDGFADDDLPF